MTGNSVRLCIPAFAIALGLTSGLCILALGLLNHYYGLGTTMVSNVGELYKGFDSTLYGSFVGAGWGFLKGFVAGIVIACVYNVIACCCCGTKRCSSKD